MSNCGQWIPVSERAPMEGERVMTWEKGHPMTEHQIHIWPKKGALSFNNPTHWMPLPEPPE